MAERTAYTVRMRVLWKRTAASEVGVAVVAAALAALAVVVVVVAAAVAVAVAIHCAS